MICWLAATFCLLSLPLNGEMIEAMLMLPPQIPVQFHFSMPTTTTSPPPPPLYKNCRNQTVGAILDMNMKKDARLAEKAISVAIRERYSGPWFVTCGYEDLRFSRVSPNYCEFNNGEVYCYVFQPYDETA